MTALISSRGVIVAKVEDPETGSIREPGFLRGELEILEPRKTFYTQWGEWPVAASFLGLVLGFWRRREAA